MDAAAEATPASASLLAAADAPGQLGGGAEPVRLGSVAQPVPAANTSAGVAPVESDGKKSDASTPQPNAQGTADGPDTKIESSGAAVANASSESSVAASAPRDSPALFTGFTGTVPSPPLPPLMAGSMSRKRKHPSSSPCAPGTESPSAGNVGDSYRPDVTLDRDASDKGIEIAEDKLTARGKGGYRMLFATDHVPQGCFYYEVAVGGNGHVRLGWATESAEMMAPCGFDQFGFSYGSRSGDKYHLAKAIAYGEPFGAGDTVGVLITLPGKPRSYNTNKRQYGAALRLERSKVEFFVNGKSQGVAFENLQMGKYYPCASLYMGVELKFNFGPAFKFKPEVKGVEVAGMDEAPQLVRIRRRSSRDTKPVHYNSDMVLDEKVLYGPGAGPFKNANEGDGGDEDGDEAEFEQPIPEMDRTRTGPREGMDIESTRWGSRYKRLNWTNANAPPWLPTERGWLFCSVKRATGLEMVKTETFYCAPEGVVYTSRSRAHEAVRLEEQLIAEERGDRNFPRKRSRQPRRETTDRSSQRIKLYKLTACPMHNRVVQIRSPTRGQADTADYWLVFNHLTSTRTCVLVPMFASGVFSSSSKKRKGRTRWKLRPDRDEEITVAENRVTAVPADAVNHNSDLNKEVWDIREGEDD